MSTECEWFCRIMGEEWGPMSAQELLAVARRGRLTRNDTVRRGPDGTWVRAEMVRGLFNSAPPASTATTHRIAISSRQPSPARRSVQLVDAARFWVNAGKKLAGPFSEQQLRRYAAEGRLRPDHLVSSDRVQWFRAAEIRGLAFGGASPQASTMSIRSAVRLSGPVPQPMQISARQVSASGAELATSDAAG